MVLMGAPNAPRAPIDSRGALYCPFARYREARAEVPDSFGLVANKIWKDRLVVVSPSLAIDVKKLSFSR